MNIIRSFGALAREFLEREVEAFEVLLATKGNELTTSEYEWRDNWQGYGAYDHLLELKLGLFCEQDVYIEAIKVEDYQVIYQELDDFLLLINSNEKSDIIKDSDTYKVLARKFLLAKIESFKVMNDICSGCDFEYQFITGTPQLKEGEHFANPTKINVKKWKRSAQANYQTLVIKKAKLEMLNDSDLTKEALSDILAKKVFFDDGSSNSAATILRNYLDNHPNY
jgi:hypothetical protein